MQAPTLVATRLLMPFISSSFPARLLKSVDNYAYFNFLSMKNITTKQEREAAAMALTEAFSINKSVRQLIGRDDQGLRLKRLIAFALAEAAEFGKIVSEDSDKAFAVVIYPDRVRLSFRSLSRTLYFILRIAGLKRILAVLKKEAKLKALKKSSFGDRGLYYLWFIGLAKKDQGKGRGTALLRELMAEAQNMGRILVLETSSEENIPFYWKAGLECYQVLKLKFPLYCFRAQD